MRRFALCCGSVFVLLSIASASSRAGLVVSTWSGGGESYSDPFDVSQGATLLDSSPLAPGVDARSAIGYSNASFIEPDTAYFADGGTPGALDYITFRTAAPVTVSGFHLRMYDDSYNGAGVMARGFSSVSLLASADGISYTVLASGMLGNSYLASYGYWGILVEATFAPTTAQYFRFEGTRATPFGPRIVELDGLQPVPEPSSLVSAALGMAALAGYAGWRRERRRVVG